MKHSVTTCGSKCNINCLSSTFTILSTLISLYSHVLTAIYIYIYINLSMPTYNWITVCHKHGITWSTKIELCRAAAMTSLLYGREEIEMLLSLLQETETGSSSQSTDTTRHSKCGSCQNRGSSSSYCFVFYQTISMLS